MSDATNVIQEVREALAEWDGAYATIYDFSQSHRRLTVRLGKLEREFRLWVVFHSCEYIAGPVQWDDCAIKIVEQGEEGTVRMTAVDEKVGFKVIFTGGVACSTMSPDE